MDLAGKSPDKKVLFIRLLVKYYHLKRQSYSFPTPCRNLKSDKNSSLSFFAKIGWPSSSEIRINTAPPQRKLIIFIFVAKFWIHNFVVLKLWKLLEKRIFVVEKFATQRWNRPGTFWQCIITIMMCTHQAYDLYTSSTRQKRRFSE